MIQPRGPIEQPYDHEPECMRKASTTEMAKIVGGIIKAVKYRYPVINDPDAVVWDAVNDVMLNQEFKTLRRSFFYSMVYRQIVKVKNAVEKEFHYIKIEQDRISESLLDASWSMDDYLCSREVVWTVKEAMLLEDELNEGRAQRAHFLDAGLFRPFLQGNRR
jgi:hypothetical protein